MIPFYVLSLQSVKTLIKLNSFIMLIVGFLEMTYVSYSTVSASVSAAFSLTSLVPSL